jgi:uncharacterized protein with HEPN domain
MQPKSPKLLEDVRDATEFILEVTRAQSLESYLESRLLRQAVERNFEIIGEALHRLSRTDPDVSAQVGEVPRIVAFRNMLIHGYDVLDHEVVWEVVKNDVPNLLKQIKALLAEVKINPR